MKLQYILIVCCSLLSCSRHTQPIQPGNGVVPHERKISWKTQSDFADKNFSAWANKSISIDKLNGKGVSPRILLAKLLLKKDIPNVNYLLTKLKVWGVSGSSWAFNKKGDYDFTLTPLTTLLFLLGDQPSILYPATKEYLLTTLLSESGNQFRYKAPKTWGTFDETENHILMTEGSRYLKNRWIMLHGNSTALYNNIDNGMEAKLLSFLEGINSGGLYEFNSIPYSGYTITALLNLEAFASEKVKLAARNVLDYMNWTYALGCYQFKHYPPMRRRYEKASITSITTDYHSVFLKAWLSYLPLSHFSGNEQIGDPHALMASCLPYRPADKVVDLIFNKGDGYFVKIGHGKNSCPEIYAAGKKYLLSSGGANRGKFSEIIARPICLFLPDSAKDLSQVIHLSGPGTNFMGWNNTGVYKNFACAAGPVYVPESFKPLLKTAIWTIYSLSDSLLVAVHSKVSFGLVAIFNRIDTDRLLSTLIECNPDSNLLNTRFQFPGGQLLHYDVLAPNNQWVIISANNIIVNRDFDQWPLIESSFE